MLTIADVTGQVSTTWPSDYLLHDTNNWLQDLPN